MVPRTGKRASSSVADDLKRNLALPYSKSAHKEPHVKHVARSIIAILKHGFRASVVATVLGLQACATLQGMPAQSVALQWPRSVNDAVPLSNEIVRGREGYSSEERNAWIEANLISVNKDYNAFVTNLQQNRAGWAIGTGILDLTFDVASSLTPSAGVKANYAAASALLTGSYAVIDKEAFLEKTVSALVSAMNARRKEALVAILAGMRLSTDQYPLAVAHEDLLEYQRSGSLLSGLSFVESASKEKEEDAADAIKTATALNTSERSLRRCITLAVQAVPDAKKDQLKTAAGALDPTALGKSTLSEIRNVISSFRLNPDPSQDRQFHAELKKQNLIGDC